jgi:hypothetical protein
VAEHIEIVDDDNDEKLDLDLLLRALDCLVEEPNLNVMVALDPSKKVKEEVEYNLSAEILELIINRLHTGFWANPPDDVTIRPKICIRCISIRCDHVNEPVEKSANMHEIMDKASKQCEHPKNEESMLGNICMQCALGIFSGISLDPLNQDPVRLIWDTIDYGQYASYIAYSWKDTVN